MLYEIPAPKFSYLYVRKVLFSADLQNITFCVRDRLTDFLITKTAGGAYPLYATHENIASEIELPGRLSAAYQGNEGKGRSWAGENYI